MHIDETGRDNKAMYIDPLLGVRVIQQPGAGDLRDAVTRDRKVAIEPLISGAIDDLAARKNDIVAVLREGSRRASERIPAYRSALSSSSQSSAVTRARNRVGTDSELGRLLQKVRTAWGETL